MNIPEVTAENTRMVLRHYAWLRAMAKEIKDLEEGVKLYLDKVLQPGETLAATDDDGNRLLTVSMSKVTTNEVLVVDDPLAFALWLDSKGIMHSGRTTVVFTDPEDVSDATLTKHMARNGGELPDGVVMTVNTTGGVMRPSQSKAQREATVAMVAQIREFVAAAQLEAAESETDE